MAGVFQCVSNLIKTSFGDFGLILNWPKIKVETVNFNQFFPSMPTPQSPLVDIYDTRMPSMLLLQGGSHIVQCVAVASAPPFVSFKDTGS